LDSTTAFLERVLVDPSIGGNLNKVLGSHFFFLLLFLGSGWYAQTTNTTPTTQEKRSMPMQDSPTPLYDMVIVRPSDKQEKTAGGLWLPKPMVEDIGVRVAKGVVVRTGKGRRHPGTGYVFPPEVKPGDIVLYNQALDVGDNLGEEGLVLVAEDNILAIVDA